MADKIYIGTQAGRANLPTSPACGHWETLLTDMLDGLLQPVDEPIFTGHMATCAYCTDLFEQARRGREWLEFLAPEPEVPAHLLERILADTSHGKPGEGKFAPGRLAVAGGSDAGNALAMPPAWQRPGFAASLRRFAEPRLWMTAAMAFFSIALTLSMTGVRFTSIKMTDLRPASLRSALEKRIMTASTPIVRYYDHLRFVYEVESTVRQMRRNTDSGVDGGLKTASPAASDPSQDPSQDKGQPTGQTRPSEGGSRLNPGSNPNNAPQQTVNPPVRLWGDETAQARLQLPAGRRRNTLNPAPSNDSGLPEPLAMPEGSTSCLA